MECEPPEPVGFLQRRAVLGLDDRVTATCLVEAPTLLGLDRVEAHLLFGGGSDEVQESGPVSLGDSEVVVRGAQHGRCEFDPMGMARLGAGVQKYMEHTGDVLYQQGGSAQPVWLQQRLGPLPHLAAARGYPGADDGEV